MSSEEILSLAIELINAGKKDNARSAIRQAIERDPDDIAAWALLVQAAEDIDEEMADLMQTIRASDELLEYLCPPSPDNDISF